MAKKRETVSQDVSKEEIDAMLADIPPTELPEIPIVSPNPDDAEPGEKPPARGEEVPAEQVTAAIQVVQKKTVGAQPLTPYNPSPEGQRRVSTSLDVSTPEGTRHAYRSLQGRDTAAADTKGEIYDVVNWLCHDVETVDEKTGELSKWVRTVLICKDGTRVDTGSAQILSSLMALSSFYGSAPWNPPLKLSIQPQQSSKKRTFFILDVHV